MSDTGVMMKKYKEMTHLFELLPFPSFAIHEDKKKIIYANKEAEAVFLEEFQECIKNEYEDTKEMSIEKINKQMELLDIDAEKETTFVLFYENVERWYQHHVKRVTLDNGEKIRFIIMVNINEVKLAQNQLSEAHAQLILKNKELEILNSIDSLTRVYNRMKIEVDLRQIIQTFKEKNRPYCVALLDIDHFKKINDNHGHLVGDKVLKSMATIMKNILQEKGTIGRWGGEEFLILLHNTTLEEGYVLIQEMLHAIRNFSFEGSQKVTCSLGISELQEEDCVESIVGRVDKALYVAKNSGRDRVERI